MKFNRRTAADDAAEKFAKNQAKKLGKKAWNKFGKKAAKAGAKWLFTVLGSLGPLLLIVPIIVCLFCLPSILFSSTAGTDAAYADDTLISNIPPDWEADANAAVAEREDQLSSMTFWSDALTFFTTGSWGTANETFKTEFANAKDTDDDGNEIATGYFSSSNRIIALIDEAFRSSLRKSKSGIAPRALTEGYSMAQNRETEFRAAAPAKPDDVADDDYTVTYTIKRDDGLDEMHFVDKACYLLAAASANYMQNDENRSGVRKVLDYAFALTGLDNDPNVAEICWEPDCSAEYEVIEETIAGDEHDVYVDETGTFHDITTPVYVDASGGYHPLNPSTSTPDMSVTWTKTTVGSPDRKKMTVNITATYTIKLKSNFEDLVNEMCGISDEVDPSGFSSISIKDMVETSAKELKKFYYSVTFLDMENVGLPLPPHQYGITSSFDYRIDPFTGQGAIHTGTDIAAALGTPIYAVADGTCQTSGHHESYGICVLITHPDGTKTRYAHMSRCFVSDGQEVVAGEQIGEVGSTGRSTGPHLHFEVYTADGERVDPMQTSVGELIAENANYNNG